MEEYRIIEEFPDFAISRGGVVVNLITANIVKDSNCRGYRRVNLNDGVKYSPRYIHRLLLLCYVPNPENKLETDHINRIRNDNRLVNLRWATRSENLLNRAPYIRRSGLIYKKRIKV